MEDRYPEERVIENRVQVEGLDIFDSNRRVTRSVARALNNQVVGKVEEFFNMSEDGSREKSSMPHELPGSSKFFNSRSEFCVYRRRGIEPLDGYDGTTERYDGRIHERGPLSER
ncbi:unnamed protein product [Ceratitis capitata]|uniref:(Mediterranean fruit fly) hypothetical protein n=1 Tax=Ceratitis capitata TaxID=7213 RepID=A0A811UUI0_CERCA|nr:unnamed protein product [Ceratitis capitata]